MSAEPYNSVLLLMHFKWRYEREMKHHHPELVKQRMRLTLGTLTRTTNEICPIKNYVYCGL